MVVIKKVWLLLTLIIFIPFTSISQNVYESSYSFCFPKNDNQYHNLNHFPSDSLCKDVCVVDIWVKKDTLIWEYLKPFTNLEQIQVPVIGQRSLKIPSAICSLRQLKVIYHLRKKTTFPSCFSSLDNLEELSIPWSKFNTIPPEIYNLPNLKILRIGKYTGKELTPEINKLKNLEELQMNNISTKIKEIPPVIYELDNLKSFNCHTKKIIYLDDKVGQLKLATLYLNIDLTDSNTIEILSKMKRLKTLSVWKLSEIPTDIGKLSFLKALTVNKSKLSKEEQETLKKQLPNTSITYY